MDLKSLAHARNLDQKDNLATFKKDFHIPKNGEKDVIYLCGNSLGLQPKSTASYIEEELKNWAEKGVEGHFTGEKPWLRYHQLFDDPLSELIGAQRNEVVCMNSLTVNIHLLMVSFYKPKNNRTKILIEADCFPSDRYAIASQIEWHGLDPKEHIIEIKSEDYYLDSDRVKEIIQTHKNELALVWLGGVNYFSGQVLDMKTISDKAHEVGAYVGFDLAHAIGNIPLYLHNWNVDFATWCSYKYLNSGAGGVSGIYVHERYSKDENIKKLAGWWGTTEESRFQMKKTFEPIPSAESWQLSNAPILSMAAHKASLDLFEKAGLDNIFEKSKKLTAYLNFLLEDLEQENKLKIITPKERGCQLSILVYGKDQGFIFELKERGVILDWRKPKDSNEEYGVMRVAPVQLYNSFEQVWEFVQTLTELL